MSLLCVKLSSGSHLESKLKFDIWWTLMPCLLWRLSRHLWCRLLLSLHSFCFDRTAFLSGFYHVRQAFILKPLHKLLTPPGKLLPPPNSQGTCPRFFRVFVHKSSSWMSPLPWPHHLQFQHFFPPSFSTFPSPSFALFFLSSFDYYFVYLFIYLTDWLVSC